MLPCLTNYRIREREALSLPGTSLALSLLDDNSDRKEDGTMLATRTDKLIDPLREAVHPLAGASTDYDPLLEMIGDSCFVLIGEASHGTHDFYRERAQLT